MPIRNTIPVATAVTWVKRWRESDHTMNLKGFFIPGIDLTQLLAETGVVDGRTYMAIDEDGNFHLLFVGVDSEGNDMINPDADQYIYDFTQPCPAICSSTGVLK